MIFFLDREELCVCVCVCVCVCEMWAYYNPITSILLDDYIFDNDACQALETCPLGRLSNFVCIQEYSFNLQLSQTFF